MDPAAAAAGRAGGRGRGRSGRRTGWRSQMTMRPRAWCQSMTACWYASSAIWLDTRAVARTAEALRAARPCGRSGRSVSTAGGPPARWVRPRRARTQRTARVVGSGWVRASGLAPRYIRRAGTGRSSQQPGRDRRLAGPVRSHDHDGQHDARSCSWWSSSTMALRSAPLRSQLKRSRHPRPVRCGGAGGSAPPGSGSRATMASAWSAGRSATSSGGRRRAGAEAGGGDRGGDHGQLHRQRLEQLVLDARRPPAAGRRTRRPARGGAARRGPTPVTRHVRLVERLARATRRRARADDHDLGAGAPLPDQRHHVAHELAGGIGVGAVAEVPAEHDGAAERRSERAVPVVEVDAVGDHLGVEHAGRGALVVERGPVPLGGGDERVGLADQLVLDGGARRGGGPRGRPAWPASARRIAWVIRCEVASQRSTTSGTRPSTTGRDRPRCPCRSARPRRRRRRRSRRPPPRPWPGRPDPGGRGRGAGVAALEPVGRRLGEGGDPVDEAGRGRRCGRAGTWARSATSGGCGGCTPARAAGGSGAGSPTTAGTGTPR